MVHTGSIGQLSSWLGFIAADDKAFLIPVAGSYDNVTIRRF